MYLVQSPFELNPINEHSQNHYSMLGSVTRFFFAWSGVNMYSPQGFDAKQNDAFKHFPDLF